MRSFLPPALIASALLAFAAGAPMQAQAQEMYPGADVTVNPVAGTTRVLLYPGGQYLRVVQPLRQPGDTGGAIHLHMPRRAAVTRKPAAAPPTPIARTAPPPERAAARTAVSQPPAGYAGPPSAGRLLSAALPPAPTRLANAEPAPSAAETGTAGLVKRSVILFAPNAADPAQSSLGEIKILAGLLASALTRANSRVELLAYGGKAGDKGLDARRIALKRALAIRQVLIDDGVPSERIDVQPKGGAEDGGPPDRVDVYIRA